jgi:hypothetical protein
MSVFEKVIEYFPGIGFQLDGKKCSKYFFCALPHVFKKIKEKNKIKELYLNYKRAIRFCVEIKGGGGIRRGSKIH